MINEANTFIAALREKTAANHAALEESRLSKALMSPALKKEDYLHYLRALYPFIAGAEKKVYPLLKNIIGDLSDRNKTALLVADLIALGMTPAEIDDLRLQDFPAVTEADAMGIMYVLEGSTLGGRILYKQVCEKLGAEGQASARFFYGYGERTGPMWHRFIEQLTAFADRSAEKEQIIGAAEKTFKQLEDDFR